MAEGFTDTIIKLLEEINGLKSRVSYLETLENTRLSSLSHNLIKNYPSLEGADGAAPMYWSGISCTLTEEDATGEGLSNSPNERILKGVTTSPTGLIRQIFTPSDERLLTASDTIVSFGVWVYVVTAGTLYVRLYDSGVPTLLGQASTTTTGGWVYLEVPGITIGANNLLLYIQHSATGATFYVANPILNVGASVAVFSPRGERWRDANINLVNGIDPGGAGYTAVDVATAVGNNNVTRILLRGAYSNTTTANRAVNLRRPDGSHTRTFMANYSTSAVLTRNETIFMLDDNGQFEYDTTAPAGETEALYMITEGYWEWE